MSEWLIACTCRRVSAVWASVYVTAIWIKQTHPQFFIFSQKTFSFFLFLQVQVPKCTTMYMEVHTTSLKLAIQLQKPTNQFGVALYLNAIKQVKLNAELQWYCMILNNLPDRSSCLGLDEHRYSVPHLCDLANKDSNHLPTSPQQTTCTHQTQEIIQVWSYSSLENYLEKLM